MDLRAALVASLLASACTAPAPPGDSDGDSATTGSTSASPTTSIPSTTSPTTSPASTSGDPVTSTSGSTGGPLAPDCTPRDAPIGAAPGTDERQPGSLRVRIAASDDGLAFARIDVTVLDQAATPSFLPGKAPPMLYYTAHRIDGARDGAAVSIGTDDGASWRHCLLEFEGLPMGVNPVDPDLAVHDGEPRMFITGPVGGGKLGIHYLDSEDGITWTYGGVAFEHDEPVIDSATAPIGASWEMFVLPLDGVDMIHARSSDGDGFAFVDQALRTIAGRPHVLSQAAEVGSVTHVYGFGPMGQEIRSLTTTDGASFDEEPTLHLAFDPADPEERMFIKDPAVLRLPGGRYLMAYATAIP